jgi:hypothetical protein
MSEAERMTRNEKAPAGRCRRVALAAPAHAEIGDPWMLLTAGWWNGEGPHAWDPQHVYEQFPTKAACETELRNQVHKYAGRSHAEGGDFMALCSNINTWTLPK